MLSLRCKSCSIYFSGVFEVSAIFLFSFYLVAAASRFCTSSDNGERLSSNQYALYS